MSELGSTEQPDDLGYDQYGSPDGSSEPLGFDGLPFVREQDEDYGDWSHDDPVAESTAPDGDDILAEPFLGYDPVDTGQIDGTNERLVRYGDSTAGIVREDEVATEETPVSPAATQTRPYSNNAQQSPWMHDLYGQPPASAPAQAAEMEAVPQEAQNVRIVPDKKLDAPVNGPVYEGIVVGEVPKAKRPFDVAALKLGRNIVYVGQERDSTDRALYETVVSEAERLNAKTGRKVIIVVDAAPGPEPPIVAFHNPEIYNLVTVEATDDALTAQLTPSQLAEALAALTSGDIGERAELKTLYGTLTNGLITRATDSRGRYLTEEDGSYKLQPPTIKQIIAAVNHYSGAQRGDHGTELDSLTPDQWEVIERTNLVGKQRKEAWKPLFSKAKAFLEQSYPGKGNSDALPLQQLEQIRDATIGSDDPDIITPNTTVLLIRMGVQYGGPLRAARAKTVAELVPLLAENTDWLGEPAGLAIEHADRLPKRDEPGASDTDEMMRLAIVDKRIRTILSATQLTDESPWFLKRGVFGVMPVDSTTAKAVSAILGTKQRRDKGSVSSGSSYNDGVNVSGGAGGSYEPGQEVAINTNSNGGGGASVGSAAHIDTTINYAEGPRVRELDLGGLRPGQIAVVGAFGGFSSSDYEGLYSVYHREHLGAWPPEEDDGQEIIRRVMDGMSERMLAMEKRVAMQFGKLAAGQVKQLEPGRRAPLPLPPVENGNVTTNNSVRNMADFKREFVAFQHSVKNHNRRAGHHDPRRVPRTWQEYAQIMCDDEHAKAIERADIRVRNARYEGNADAKRSDFYNPADHSLDAYMRRKGLIK